MRATINGKEYALTRGDHNGAEWRVSLGELPVGKHRIQLASPSNDDQTGTLNHKLTVTAPEK